MQLSTLTLLLTLVSTSVFAQWNKNHIKLSHNITTETISTTGFNKLSVSEDFEVYIRFSDKEEKVEIEANENLHDLIQVENDGQTLKIFTKSYSTSYRSYKNDARERLVAYITTKTLSEISADEDVIIELEDKLFADKLTINLHEDSALTGYLEVKNLVVNLDEDSILDIEGSARTMDVKANEDSVIHGLAFIVGNVSIKLNEDSKAKLTVLGEIDLRANEDSYFYYKGDGYFTRKRLTGDSEVRHW